MNTTKTSQFDEDYVRKFEVVKKDPYRFILSKREFEGCYNRAKRLAFTLSITGGYLYYSIRHKQELGLIRGLKLNKVFYYTNLPKAIVLAALTYPIGYSFFVDFDKKKLHNIAKVELMKFDETWWDRSDMKYHFRNAKIYDNEDSLYGRNYPLLGLFNYHQVPGYIRRLREKNPDILKDLPPKYDFTPEGPRKIDPTKINVTPKIFN